MPTISYEKFETQDRRLVILKALSNAAQYRANAFLLRNFCDQVGHTVSADKLAGDLAWLSEAGLVTIEAPSPDVTVATLTPRGLDVADGRVDHPGVQRPRPV
jgi:hypothetical protein